MIKGFIYFLKVILQQRYLIFSMAKREIATKYIGSSLGFIWTFINPIVMIFIFWFVFSLGFKAKSIQDVPFVVWLTAGMSIWFVFSDIVNGCVSVIIENANLIKKTLFYSPILPIIKIISNTVTHAIFLVILMILIVFQKMPLDFYYLQFLYYLFCMIVLALGIGWATSALNVFIRDIQQVVGISLQIGFWMTPIFWDIHLMPEKVQTILKLNPVFYLIQGYRDSFIYFIPFWRHPYLTLYFWTVTITLFVIGAMIFKKLKPHFADVL